jgi:uncharacterized protein YqeY
VIVGEWSYMNLKEQIEKDFIEAYKAKDELKSSTLRMIKSAIKNKEIVAGKELDNSAVTDIVVKEIKQRRDSANEYKKGGRTELAEKEEKEIDILKIYIPEQLTEEEIIKIVDNAIAKTNASSISDIGKVMGVVMPEVKGKSDGTLVSKIVKEKLSK